MARRRMIEITIAHDKVFNSLCDFDQLLYLKVLPHTDDYGRFEGDPVVLKARIAPLSTHSPKKYDDGINRISEAGLWIRYQTPEERLVIQYNRTSFERINAFMIKKKGKEEYLEYKDGYKLISSDISPISHREYKAESNKYKVESKGEEREKGDVAHPILQDAGVSVVWREFVEDRRERKSPMTRRGEGMLLKSLSELSGGDPIIAAKIVAQSIANGWKGLFELNGQSKPKSKLSQSRPSDFSKIDKPTWS